MSDKGFVNGCCKIVQTSLLFELGSRGKEMAWGSQILQATRKVELQQLQVFGFCFKGFDLASS